MKKSVFVMAMLMACAAQAGNQDPWTSGDVIAWDKDSPNYFVAAFPPSSLAGATQRLMDICSNPERIMIMAHGGHAAAEPLHMDVRCDKGGEKGKVNFIGRLTWSADAAGPKMEGQVF